MESPLSVAEQRSCVVSIWKRLVQSIKYAIVTEVTGSVVGKVNSKGVRLIDR